MNWISVKVLLPGQCWRWEKVGDSQYTTCSLSHNARCNEGDEVLITNNKEWSLAIYSHNQWEVFYGPLEVEDITHWMPIKRPEKD